MYLFEVIGEPSPQKQSECACDCPSTRKCKKWMYNPSKKEKEMIQWQIKPFVPEKPLTGAIELTIAFYLPIPKKTTSKNRQAMLRHIILPLVPPDEDNMSYLVTNALKNFVYVDDKQICAKHVYKFYGEVPKTVIKVREIQTLEPVGLHAADF